MTPAAQPTLSPRGPLIVGIAGCSGSGKTILARGLRDRLHARLLPLDAYYRDLAHFAPEQRDRTNFDHPDALESELLLAHLRELAAGRSIDRPCYDFATHTRTAETQRIEPAPVVLVEGILALHFPELRALFALALYVETSDALCLARRIRRDTHERGRTEASVREQYESTARPMAEQYVHPSAVHANLTVDGTEPPEQNVARVIHELECRRLLP